MTHHSEVRYGGYVLADNGSCAKSGPVRVRYFDPATGEPTAHKAEPRKRGKGSRKRLVPGVVPPGAIAVTVDGKPYESIAEAARREGISPSTLRMARKMGWTRSGRHRLSFG